MAAAVDIQRALAAYPWPADCPVRVRMGVHTGEVAQTAVGLVGLEVHRAARIAAIAHGGQITVSAAAAALLTGSLPPGTSLRDLGRHRLKDLGGPERIFQVDTDGLPSAFPLHGGADAALAALGETVDSLEARLRDADRDRLIAAMGGAAFDAEHAAGRAMTPEEIAGILRR